MKCCKAQLNGKKRKVCQHSWQIPQVTARRELGLLSYGTSMSAPETSSSHHLFIISEIARHPIVKSAPCKPFVKIRVFKPRPKSPA